MIIWLTGNTGAGKTTLARKMRDYRTIVLDGDDLRYVWNDKDLSKDGRWGHNIRVARLAKLLESQGFNVIVAVICPYDDLRKEVRRITGCVFMYLPYGKSPSERYPYEIPIDIEWIYKRRVND